MPDSTPHDPERRRYPRVKASIPIELICSDKPAMRTSVDEIGLCGSYIETMFTMEIGTKLDLVLWLNEEKITAKSIVVTEYPQLGNGIDFVEMLREDRLKLGAYIASCDQRSTGEK